MGIFRKNKEYQRTGVDLSQVIRGMQHAVNEAQRTLEVHHLKSLLRFFYADGDPKSVDLHLGGTKHIDIPLVTLANHSSLKIDELEMEFKARIEEVAIKDLDELNRIVSESGRPLESEDDDASASAATKLDGDSSEDGSATFNIGFSSAAPRGVDAGNVISVRIKFLSADQPEGLSRIVDEYNKLVAPYDVHPSSGDSDDPPTFVFDDEPSHVDSEEDDREHETIPSTDTDGVEAVDMENSGTGETDDIVSTYPDMSSSATEQESGSTDELMDSQGQDLVRDGKNRKKRKAGKSGRSSIER